MAFRGCVSQCNKQGKTIGFSARRQGDGVFWGTSPIPLKHRMYEFGDPIDIITVYRYNSVRKAGDP